MFGPDFPVDQPPDLGDTEPEYDGKQLVIIDGKPTRKSLIRKLPGPNFWLFFFFVPFPTLQLPSSSPSKHLF